MRSAACAGTPGRGARCRGPSPRRSLGLLGRDDGWDLGRRRGRLPAPSREGPRTACGLLSGVCERHAARRCHDAAGRLRASCRRGRTGGRRGRGRTERQLRQARRHRQGGDDLLCRAVQDGLLQPRGVVRELGLGHRRLQRRHLGCTADQDARAGRDLHPDPRREPPGHAGLERPLRAELHARHVAQLDPGLEGRGLRHGGARRHHRTDQPRTPQADGRGASLCEPLPRRRAAPRGQHLDRLPRLARRQALERAAAPRFGRHRRAEDGPQWGRLPRPAALGTVQRGQQVALCGRQRHADPLGLEVCRGEPLGRHARLPQHAVDARGDGPGVGLGADRRHDAPLRVAHPQPQRQRLFQAGHARRGVGL